MFRFSIMTIFLMTCFTPLSASEQNALPIVSADCRFEERAMAKPTPEADAVYKEALLYDSSVDEQMYPPKADRPGENDDAKAIKFYMQAAKMGHAKAMRRLGDLLYRDNLSSTLAVLFYAKALEAGNKDAYSSLAGVYFYGGDGVEKNTEKGMACLYRGAERGHAYTQLVLGAVLLHELNHLLEAPTPKDAPFDPIQAEQWLIKAGEGGEIQAYELLARHYYNPPKPDLKQSENYARACASKGDKACLTLLANGYKSEGKYGHDYLLALCFQRLADTAQKGVAIDLDAACPKTSPKE